MAFIDYRTGKIVDRQPKHVRDHPIYFIDETGNPVELWGMALEVYLRRVEIGKDTPIPLYCYDGSGELRRIN